MADEDKLLVVPLGEESKAITQTISNDTAMRILELLADNPMSTSAIAKKLNIPLTTAQYNIEKLIEAGLVKVDKTKYSEKGREVKLYTPAKRFIILVPEKTVRQAVVDVLKKYLILLPVAAVISAIVDYLIPLRQDVPQALIRSAGSVSGNITGDASIPIELAAKDIAPATPSLEPAPSLILDQLGQSLAIADPLHHSGVWFFMGCLLIIAVVVVLEYMKYRNIRFSK